MHEGNLVICDQEQQYARNLLQMFARNREPEVQMYLFHTTEEVEKFAEQKTVHTLLISKEYPLGQREKIPAAERFVLVKSRQDSLAENEVGVYRYQSANAIWSQIRNGSAIPQTRNGSAMPELRSESAMPGLRSESAMPELRNGSAMPQLQGGSAMPQKSRKGRPWNSENNERGQNPQDVKEDENRKSPKGFKTKEREQTEPFRKNERNQKVSAKCQTKTTGELIGVYSPVHRIGKTRFAMKLGRELAKKEPVLYLNLEEYAGGSYYFPDQTGQTLADLLYYARQEKGNLGLRISSIAGQDEELDYILPMPYVQDMQGVSGEEWLKLFEQILENCIYQKVILDLGDSVNGLFQILEACDTVYTPYIEDEAARAKLNQYAENLRKTGREKVLERTVQKKLKHR